LIRCGWEGGILRGISSILAFSIAMIASRAYGGSIDLEKQLLIFGGTVSSVEDPTGKLGNQVAVGDAFTVTIEIPIDIRSVGSSPNAIVEGYLDGAYTIDVANLRWQTTGTNRFPNGGDFDSHPYMYIADDAPGGDFYNFTTDPIGWSYGSPIDTVPYWEGNVGAGSPFRVDPFIIDPFEAPDPLDFDFSGAYVYGYAEGSTDTVYRIEASITTSRLAPVPEPALAALLALAGVALVALRRRRVRVRA
jgi:hypothetical protein